MRPNALICRKGHILLVHQINHQQIPQEAAPPGSCVCISRLQQKTLQARLTLTPLKRILVSEATPLAWYWLFSKTEVLLDCYQRGTHYPRRPVATLLWCKPLQSKRSMSIHFVQSRNCDNLLSSLFI
jgi:hypothetical protein